MVKITLSLPPLSLSDFLSLPLSPPSLSGKDTTQGKLLDTVFPLALHFCSAVDKTQDLEHAKQAPHLQLQVSFPNKGKRQLISTGPVISLLSTDKSAQKNYKVIVTQKSAQVHMH